jgi:hypothetical protein
MAGLVDVAGGGFSGYRPLTALPARSVVVIQLIP